MLDASGSLKQQLVAGCLRPVVGGSHVVSQELGVLFVCVYLCFYCFLERKRERNNYQLPSVCQVRTQNLCPGWELNRQSYMGRHPTK